MHHTAILSLLILLVLIVVSSGQRNQNPNTNSNNPNNHNPNVPPTPTHTPTLVPTQTPTTTLKPTPMGSNGQKNPNFPPNGPTLNNRNNFPNPNIPPTPTPTPTPLPFMAAWGYNIEGQIGDGTQTQRNISTAVITTALIGYKMTEVACGGLYSLSLSSDGKVFAWGDNAYGQLGDGSGSSQSSPVAVDTSTSSALNGITVTAISAGYHFSLALSSTGKVYSWGYNYFGQLGDGSNTTVRYIPVAVDTSTSSALNGKTVTAISAGLFHSLALSSGKVYAWGLNNLGQLGDGSNTDRNIPVAVDTSGALSGITIIAISAGGYHSLALSSSGKVYSWGLNNGGQLGDNSLYNKNSPVAVNTSGSSALNGKPVSKISGGYDHSLALSGGFVYSWGSNYYGQLGDGTQSTQVSPVAASTSGGSALSGKSIVSITGSTYFSLALSSDGFVISWGDNSFGELGNNDGSGNQQNIPVFVSTNAPSDLNGKSVFAIDTGSASSTALVIIKM